jgi:hypothetical protein
MRSSFTANNIFSEFRREYINNLRALELCYARGATAPDAEPNTMYENF